MLLHGSSEPQLDADVEMEQDLAGIVTSLEEQMRITESLQYLDDHQNAYTPHQWLVLGLMII